MLSLHDCPLRRFGKLGYGPIIGATKENLRTQSEVSLR